MGFSRRSQEDFEAELRAHLELEAEQLRREGMSPEEALVTARRTFGNPGVAHRRRSRGGDANAPRHAVESHRGVAGVTMPPVTGGA
jgi:hypothetical protein